MTALAENVWYLRTLMVNVYAVRVGGGERDWVLVDTGLSGFTSSIVDGMERLFGRGSRPKAIVLTHGHFDHVGCVADLADRWDVPVYASPLEAPFLTGRTPYPPPDPLVGRGVLALSSRLYPRGPIDIGSRLVTLPGDDRVPGLDGWRVIRTPGHSPGHVSLFRDSDRTLIAGDAVTTTQQESLVAVVTQKPELHGPPAYYTIDWTEAAASVRKLADLKPSVLATGHGRPMSGPDVESELHKLADRFEQEELPSLGRYARSPARLNDDGTFMLPPDPLPGVMVRAAMVAGVALFIAATGYKSKTGESAAPPHSGDNRSVA